MSGRRPLVAGNWKMNKTGVEAREHVARLRALLGDGELAADVAVCPPFTALEAAARAASGSPSRCYAQAVHEAPSGPHTGEISAGMIVATGADGHPRRPLRAPRRRGDRRPGGRPRARGARRGAAA